MAMHPRDSVTKESGRASSGGEAVSKSFGGVAALKVCALRTARGEIHALMGENGAASRR